jgi:hypothetical protein
VLGNPEGDPMELDVHTVSDHMLRESAGGWELVNASTCAGPWTGQVRGQIVKKPGTVLASFFWKRTDAK